MSEKIEKEDVKGTIIITVVETNGCTVHKVGQTYKLLPGDFESRDALSTWACPIALHSLYPTTYWMRFNAKMPWFKEWERGVSYRVNCPDAENRVVFELKNILK